MALCRYLRVRVKLPGRPSTASNSCSPWYRGGDGGHSPVREADSRPHSGRSHCVSGRLAAAIVAAENADQGDCEAHLVEK
jgi:hypothetical protein